MPGMDFQLPKRVAPLLPRVRALVDREVIPLERQLAGGRFTELLPHLGAIRAKVKQEGLWAPPLPEELGGMGLTLLEFAFLSQELGRSPLGHYCFNCQAPDIGNMEVLHKFGTKEQQERWLRPLVAGEIRSCFSMTEPDRAGSNPVWLDTTAKKVGADYVIDGRKWFTSAADGAAFAIVMAVTEADGPPHARASQILVPTGTPGFKLVRNIPVMGEPGDDYASHAEVTYEGCRVPQANRIGEEGAGFLIAQERLGPGRIHHCMRWLGICERAFDLMASRAVARELSPGRPLGTRHVLQTWLAEQRAEINAARLMVLQAAWKIDQEGTFAAREEISLIKFFVAGVLQRTLDRAIQVHGALGMTDETPLAYWYRHERAARIYDGPDEVHQSSVGKKILERYGMKRESPR